MLEIIGFLALVYIVIKYFPEIVMFILNFIAILGGLFVLLLIFGWFFHWPIIINI